MRESGLRPGQSLRSDVDGHTVTVIEKAMSPEAGWLVRFDGSCVMTNIDAHHLIDDYELVETEAPSQL